MRVRNIFLSGSTFPRQEETWAYKVAGIDVHKKVLMVVVGETEASHPRGSFSASASEPPLSICNSCRPGCASEGCSKR